MNDILYTGASGFLGNNTILILENMNYKVTTLGKGKGDYICDLSNSIPVFNKIYKTVLHAAAKAHSIPKTEKEKQLFFDVNLEGTKNLCKALEVSGVPSNFIFISTVAVYGVETGENITEIHPLNGNTPYALSKKMAEEFLIEWCNVNKVNLSILRPSLIAGVSPSGNLAAMIKGIETGRYFRIGKGKAKKSVLMSADIAYLVPLLEKKGGIYNICDDYNPSFQELEKLISKQLGKSDPTEIPYWLAKGLALIGDCLGNRAPINSIKLDKITKSLTFSNIKAKEELGWLPLDVLSSLPSKTFISDNV